jgi:hypothetical protein
MTHPQPLTHSSMQQSHRAMDSIRDATTPTLKYCAETNVDPGSTSHVSLKRFGSEALVDETHRQRYANHSDDSNCRVQESIFDHSDPICLETV